MTILFNCTTNVVGGAVQNAANFVWHAVNDAKFDWVFALSPQVASVLDKWGMSSKKFRVFQSPARSITARRQVRHFEKMNRVDLVYTMAGPAYVRFRSPHVLGVSNPYITHARYEAFATGRTPFLTGRAVARALVQGIVARVGAEYWVFQTETSRSGFCRRFGAPWSRTFVIPNAVGKAFSSLPQDVGGRLPAALRTRGDVRIFCPAADYPHKNLRIIPQVARILRDSGRQCEFILTIPQESLTWKEIRALSESLDVRELVKNRGPFSYADARTLYEQADVVFVPSVLETFSTSYLEAMIMGRPIIVADRPFAREICGEFGVYFDPKSPKAAADALCQAVSRRGGMLAGARSAILSRYGFYEKRYRAIIDMLRDVENDVNRRC